MRRLLLAPLPVDGHMTLGMCRGVGDVVSSRQLHALTAIGFNLRLCIPWSLLSSRLSWLDAALLAGAVLNWSTNNQRPCSIGVLLTTANLDGEGARTAQHFLL